MSVMDTSQKYCASWIPDVKNVSLIPDIKLYCVSWIRYINYVCYPWFTILFYVRYPLCTILCDCAASEWIPIISGLPQGSVLGPLLFILYTSEMYKLVEKRLFAYEDDSTLLAVVHKPTVRPAVAASLNRGLARIQEWWNHWCHDTDSWQTKALVVSRSRTVSPPYGGLFLSGVSIRASPNLDILNWREVWQQAHLRRPCEWNCSLCLSGNCYFEAGETYICGHLCVTSLLFCIKKFSLNPWVLISGVEVSCWLSQSASRAPGFVPIRVSCGCVIDDLWLGLVCCTR